MVRVAADRKGTHSLQAIVSLVSRDIEERLIRDALHGHIIELAFVNLKKYELFLIIFLGFPRNSFNSKAYCCNFSSKSWIYLSTTC